MPIRIEVLEKGPTQFNMCGQVVSRPLHVSAGNIGQKLAQRLVKYAEERANETGLSVLVREWGVAVGTLDGNSSVEDRSYYVDWSNEEKTTISVVGILIKDGRPILDHGLDIQTN